MNACVCVYIYVDVYIECLYMYISAVRRNNEIGGVVLLLER